MRQSEHHEKVSFRGNLNVMKGHNMRVVEHHEEIIIQDNLNIMKRQNRSI